MSRIAVNIHSPSPYNVIALAIVQKHAHEDECVHIDAAFLPTSGREFWLAFDVLPGSCILYSICLYPASARIVRSGIELLDGVALQAPSMAPPPTLLRSMLARMLDVATP